jgi:predicted nuclease of predicted toxin-antitoxin system
MSLALYMDHHIDRRLSTGLRRRGGDVWTAFEDGYERRSDGDILARAAELGRIVFTYDEDFLEIAAEWQAAGRRFSGLVYWRSLELSVGVPSVTWS